MLKDKLIEKTAQDLKQPESLVHKVVTWQFANASQAVKWASEVEISGFGTFIISKPKVKRRLDKYSEVAEIIKQKLPSLSPHEQLPYHKKLESLAETLSFYQKKLDK